jgi:hypothetical protein
MPISGRPRIGAGEGDLGEETDAGSDAYGGPDGRVNFDLAPSPPKPGYFTFTVTAFALAEAFFGRVT